MNKFSEASLAFVLQFKAVAENVVKIALTTLEYAKLSHKSAQAALRPGDDTFIVGKIGACIRYLIENGDVTVGEYTYSAHENKNGTLAINRLSKLDAMFNDTDIDMTYYNDIWEANKLAKAEFRNNLQAKTANGARYVSFD